MGPAQVRICCAGSSVIDKIGIDGNGVLRLQTSMVRSGSGCRRKNSSKTTIVDHDASDFHSNVIYSERVSALSLAASSCDVSTDVAKFDRSLSLPYGLQTRPMEESYSQLPLQHWLSWVHEPTRYISTVKELSGDISYRHWQCTASFPSWPACTQDRLKSHTRSYHCSTGSAGCKNLSTRSAVSSLNYGEW